MPQLHLYIHQPVAIFKARVNMPGTITYPLASLTFDTVTLGAYTDIEFDMMLTLGTTEGGDDLGRVRVTKTATSTVVYIGRASKGTEDGTLVVQDDAYITVWEDYRPWAKIPYFDLDNGIDYKDGDVEPGTYLVDIPPVANTGPGFADYIDPDTGVITVEFPGGGVDLSYAMADGATIATYSWDVGDGTITVGTAASAVITATFPAGFRYVKLTVVDSNDVPHTARCPVLAVDPDDDVTLPYYKLQQRMEIKGQSLTIEIFEDMPRSTYQDGSLVLFWWDTAYDPSSREHMKFTGWLDSEQTGMERNRLGYVRKTTLTALDINMKLDKLPGFPQALSRIETESPWSYMPSLDMNKSLHYLLFWHSTAINLADFILPTDGDDYDAMRLDASGASLFAQVNSQAEKMVPDHHLTCNTLGQMVVRRNWMYDDEADRPEATPLLTEELWNNLDFEYNRHPKVHVLRSGAIKSSTALDANDEIPLVFSVAPGDAQAFGQGTSEQSENEGLALTQDDLNLCEGHRYALLNSRYGQFTFKDPTGHVFWSYEPAMMYRVELNIGATYAAQRGLSWTYANGMVKSINVDYNVEKRGTVVKATVTWQKEEFGYPASTYIPEDAEDVDYTPPTPTPFVPSDPNNPDEFYGDISGYVLWDAADVLRTWDLQNVSPTWERIDTGISGDIYDCQYMMVDADTVGAWLMTSTDIFYCADIMATTPSWTSKLSITTVRTTAVAPSGGDVVFSSMTHYWSQPGHLCVAMSTDVEDDNYLHSYYWVTEDYGATWTEVDHTSDTYTSDSATRCYYVSGRYSLASFRTDPGTLWCVRANGRTGTNSGDAAVFKSTDLGLTWSKEYTFTGGRSPLSGSILNPYPDATSPSYIAITIGGGSPTGKLFVSTDGWATATQVTEPTGHDGAFSVNNHIQRVNKNPFDDLHILALFKIDASSNADLYESVDGGTNWTLLEGFANSAITPNGWPPDSNQWVVVQYDDTPRVQLTLDNFVTLLDKTGNLASVLSGGAWSNATSAQVGGFALPKVGVNDPGYPFPAWGTYDSTTSVLTYHGRTLQKTVSQASSDEGNVSSWLMIYPPDDIVRVRIEGTYAVTYTKGPSFTDGFAIFELDAPANVTITTDVAGNSVSAPENGSDSGTFYVEFELTSGVWPTSAEDAEATTPTGHNRPHLRAWCFSSDPDIVTSATVTAKVVEMETSGAVIYEY